MKLKEIKSQLREMDQVKFILPNDQEVPAHFHVTEIGRIKKQFIDCGGTIRNEEKVNFQLFTATDFDHRLSAQKLLSIIEMSEKQFEISELEIEVEYQAETIGKYGLEFVNDAFRLIPKQTDCLAKDKCGIPAEKPKIRVSTSPRYRRTCVPGSGCC